MDAPFCGVSYDRTSGKYNFRPDRHESLRVPDRRRPFLFLFPAPDLSGLFHLLLAWYISFVQLFWPCESFAQLPFFRDAASGFKF
jgi:hypothetical protein